MFKFPSPLANRKPVFIDQLEEKDIPRFNRKLRQIARKTGKSHEFIKSQFLWEKYLRPEDSPFDVLDDLGHDCIRRGHILIADWDREIDWNKFYVLIPKRCRSCGNKSWDLQD